jgi:hypothetical protein
MKREEFPNFFSRPQTGRVKDTFREVKRVMERLEAIWIDKKTGEKTYEYVNYTNH